jgi:hypothetical protein
MSEGVPARQETSVWMMLTQLLAGPILWSAHFMLSYLLVEGACQAGWNFNIFGFNGISFIVIVLTILALIGAGWFAFKSFRGWRRIHTGRGLKEQFRENGAWFEGPSDFLYFSGFLLSVLFAGTILMVGLPALFLSPC